MLVLLLTAFGRSGCVVLCSFQNLCLCLHRAVTIGKPVRFASQPATCSYSAILSLCGSPSRIAVTKFLPRMGIASFSSFLRQVSVCPFHCFSPRGAVPRCGICHFSRGFGMRCGKSNKGYHEETCAYTHAHDAQSHACAHRNKCRHKHTDTPFADHRK